MIAVLGFAAYYGTLGMGFLWDDHVMIENNPAIREWSLKNVKEDFTSDAFRGQGDPYYRPLQLVMNRLDYTLWGLRPLGYHLTNLLFHLANSILVMELALLLGLPAVAAFGAASIFAVHPIVVEQLMIIAGRAELMAFFFSTLAILCLTRDKLRWIACGWLAYVLALFSKENAIVTPLLLATVFYFREEFAQKWRRAAMLLAAWIPYLALRHIAVGPALPQFPFKLSVQFAFQELPQMLLNYAGLLLWPWNLHSHRLLPRIQDYWFITLLLILGIVAYLLWRRNRMGLFCAAWFFLTLAPRMPLMVTGNFMLDHWAYPALVAFTLPFGQWVWKNWLSDRKIQRHVAGLCYGSALILYALLVHLNVELRGTDEKMYRWALHFTTSNPIHYNLGAVLLNTGRPREAIPHFATYKHFYPRDAKNNHALALAYWHDGKKKLAVKLLRDMTIKHPEFEPAAKSLRAALKRSPQQK